MNSNPLEKNSSSRAVIALSLVTLFCLVPFLGKAFHIDDPLFLWTARHILSHPFDFYGFSANWYGFEMPMSAIMQNPPLASYYIAAVAHFFGWKEVTIHAAFLVPALAAATGTYYVARELCLQPFYAALACVITPVFLVSGTSVMCDIMMLAFWVWAVFFWMRGLKTGSVFSLAFAALLVAVCSLTKYFGMSLIPLLFVYALVKKRRLGIWTLMLLIPVAVLFDYQVWTYRLYGKGLLAAASSYAISNQNFKGAHFLLRSLIGLSFTGGCFITVFFYSFHLRRRRTLAVGALLTTIFVFVAPFALLKIQDPIASFFYKNNAFNWPFILECYLFSLTGFGVLYLAVTDLWHNKDAEALLLFLWIVGTFVFASYLNWSDNGRSVLPMAPAIGILIFRRIHLDKTTAHMLSAKHLFLPLVPALMVALSVTYADYKLAGTARIAAREIGRTYEGKTSNLWFEGHWGFQYYMEENGGKPLSRRNPILGNGDLVIIPPPNTNLFALSKSRLRLVAALRMAPTGWITTMNNSMGAGFYSSLFGPLPFAVGKVPEQVYYVLQETLK